MRTFFFFRGLCIVPVSFSDAHRMNVKSTKAEIKCKTEHSFDIREPRRRQDKLYWRDKYISTWRYIPSRPNIIVDDLAVKKMWKCCSIWEAMINSIIFTSFYNNNSSLYFSLPVVKKHSVYNFYSSLPCTLHVHPSDRYYSHTPLIKLCNCYLSRITFWYIIYIHIPLQIN